MGEIPRPHLDGAPMRSAVQDAVRAELDALGDRLAAFRAAATGELERLAALRSITETASITGSEVAERAGVSRQTLANLRSAKRAADHSWPVDLRVLLELGLEGPQSADSLAGSMPGPPVDDHEVLAAVEQLAAEDLIAVAGRVAAGAGSPVTYWRLTAAALDDLPRRLRQATLPPSREWTAYVQSSVPEANAILAAGARALGARQVALIPAGTVAGMQRPEVAFTLEASDPHGAQTAAVSLFNELRARAGMAPRSEPVLVSALSPPQRAAGG